VNIIIIIIITTALFLVPLHALCTSQNIQV